MKAIINKVISSFSSKVNVEKFLGDKLVRESGMRQFYRIEAEHAKFLLKNLDYEPLPPTKWKKVRFLARKSDTRTFDAPLSPIQIDTKTNSIISGVLRLHVLSETFKPAIVWIELV